jgi:hypothetical protein
VKRILAAVAALALATALGAAPAYAGQKPGHVGAKGRPGVSLLRAAGGVHPLTSQFWYAEMHQSPAYSTTSVAALMDIKKPLQVSAGEHSLAEVAVADSTGSQVVEVGWTVDPTLNGDSNPHLFVYHWVNGATTCYNGCGWVDNSANPVDAGADLSADIGTAPTFYLLYDATGGKIWIQYKSTYIGYFSLSIWATASPAFTTFQKQQFFGEVYGSSAPCDDMGAGVLPTGTSPARIGSITYASGTGSVNVVRGIVTNSAYYDSAMIGTSVRSGSYGGPGAC